MVAGRGPPTEFFPSNTKHGVPFWNHIAFFLVMPARSFANA